MTELDFRLAGGSTQLSHESTEVAKFPGERLKSNQLQSVGPVRQGTRRVVVDFHENAVDTGGHTRAGQRLDKPGLAAAAVAFSPGELQGVSDVEDDGIAPLLHEGDPAHVNHQVVVTERAASFRHQDPLVPGTGDFQDLVPNLGWGDDVPF